MANFTEKSQEVPMSVKMQRVLDAVKRMPLAEQLHLLVTAELMTEAEYRQALERMASKAKPRRKPKKQQATAAKNAPKPPTP
jgi:hypothetical protein